MSYLIGIICLIATTLVISELQKAMIDIDAHWTQWVFVLINFALVALSVKSFI